MTTNQPEHWRVFCAIELDAEVQSRIQKHIERLRTSVPESRPGWNRSENIHLTIKFFGNVISSEVKRISSAASRTVSDFSSFKISIGETGVFPNSRHPRVLWIGVEDPTGRLSELQELFEKECAVEKFAKEDRPFRPHLTIARIRKPEGAGRLAEANSAFGFKAVELTVNELVVFRSELSSKGSKYTALSRHRMIEKL